MVSYVYLYGIYLCIWYSIYGICIYIRIRIRGSTLARGLSYSSYTPTPRLYTPSVFALQDTV